MAELNIAFRDLIALRMVLSDHVGLSALSLSKCSLALIRVILFIGVSSGANALIARQVFCACFFSFHSVLLPDLTPSLR